MEKIWLKKYDPGVPRSIDMSQYHSLVEVLNENFKNYSNETAYINGTGSIMISLILSTNRIKPL